jgi:hypothetical protein
MQVENHFVVIIIATGAGGGGTLAYKLAPSTKRKLMLARSDYVPREKGNWSPRTANLEGVHTKPIWRDGNGDEFHPYTNYRLGGNTKSYEAALSFAQGRLP